MTAAVQITLNPNGVIAPAVAAIRDNIEVVARCLSAFDADDFSVQPRIDGEAMEVSFEPSSHTSIERRAICVNWVLCKGLHELAKGVRASLEEAHLYPG